MNLPILKFDSDKVSEIRFIEFWSEYYNYPKTEFLYDERINNLTFSADDIRKLFEWKNGMKLHNHVPKKELVDGVISKLDVVNQLKFCFDISTFEASFKDISAIWKVFLLHIIDPLTYPIFDQHVYRAHVYISQGEIKEIKDSKKFKENYYHNIYLPYYNTLVEHSRDIRKIDKALWSFGKFLKTHYASSLIINV